MIPFVRPTARHVAAAFVLALATTLLPAGASAQTRVNGLLPDFTELYEKQGPAVVSIDVTQRVRRGPRTPELSEDDPFYEFFRRFGPVPRGPQRDFEAQSAGSGFIVSADGYIVTNTHVVDAADEVRVRLTDRREFIAKVVGTDKRTDVAVIKIDAKDLPKVTIGDPEKLKVGEWVVAIGKPFGLENTMTAGIVSAKGRDLPQENLVPFIQTDVAINPGNSGGPLFNLRGEVVGINSLIYSRSGGYMGLAFAIPIDVAMNTVTQIREKGRVTRGRIGVQIQEVSREAADSFGLKQAAGALVNSVEKGGPAEKAGVEAGDIILKVDGREVSNSNVLPRIITQIPPGKKVVLTVWRGGQTRDIAVTVAEMKEEAATPQRRGTQPAPKEKAKPNRMGLVLADLTPEQRKEADVKSGVLVEDIVGSIRGNIQPGDVILAIISRGATTEAKTAAQVNDYLAKLEKNASVTLQVKRG
ncbi:MAG TPA: DegQ family serine endoprotease, partial [Casimicrobiaceae bacterium]|nr:DegQ family serine endoprotease [Casimicrobiaceae bacterium]